MEHSSSCLIYYVKFRANANLELSKKKIATQVADGGITLCNAKKRLPRNDFGRCNLSCNLVATQVVRKIAQ